MIVLLSPAKNLNFKPQSITKRHSQPQFLEDSKRIMHKLQRLTKKQITALMSMNQKLTELN